MSGADAYTRGDYTLTWDPGIQDPEAVHAYLTRSYWAEGISLENVKKAMEHSLCCGVFKGGDQVGFSRVVTDRTSVAYLCDVYVLEAHRGRGLASWMLESLAEHRELQGLRRVILVTRDAHKLYLKHGFSVLAKPESYMEKRRSPV
jgi:GNAT superfamily N-acetyltransferase